MQLNALTYYIAMVIERPSVAEVFTDLHIYKLLFCCCFFFLACIFNLKVKLD